MEPLHPLFFSERLFKNSENSLQGILPDILQGIGAYYCRYGWKEKSPIYASGETFLVRSKGMIVYGKYKTLPIAIEQGCILEIELAIETCRLVRLS